MVGAALAPTGDIHAQGSREDYARAADLDARTRDTVFRDRVRPHWNADGTGFWYRVETGPGTHELVRVDIDAAERTVVTGADVMSGSPPRVGLPVRYAPRSRDRGVEAELVFDNQSGGPVDLFWLDRSGERCAYGTLAAGERRSQHTFEGHTWIAVDQEGQDLVAFVADQDLAIAKIGPAPVLSRKSPDRDLDRGANDFKAGEGDGERWEARIRGWNVVLHDRVLGIDRVLTTWGTEVSPFVGSLIFSPDQRRLAVLRREGGDTRDVVLVESSPKDQLQPKVHTVRYLKPGDRIPVLRPCLFDVQSGDAIPIADTMFPNPWSISVLAFTEDSSELTFLYNERGHQLLRVIGVDVASGEARAIVEERSGTFIDYAGKSFLHPLTATGELLWMSERDGFNHLYLYDIASGSVKRAVTHGEWVVREVLRVDENAREVWMLAGGVHPGEDPYHQHLVRASLDGGEPRVLTEGDGDHEIEFSPDRRYFIDRWSRVDQPPVTELRRSEDGAQILELERADISALLATGWTMPRRFHAKGRDGVTDIYGLMIAPSNFDPTRRYPVVEQIYAGPHGAHVPKRFSRLIGQHRMAELGFLLVQIDGMGTSHRSKAFHDVCWRNLADAGFPDRIAWMRALSEEVPQMDLARVGIYGGSAGGQNAMRALIDHGDFYKVAVADCGCHDNRMDKVWWNELWMGYAVGPWYEESSNVAHAHRMQGDLLLLVGELDRNVDPASTMQVVDALIRADKDFEMLVIPGAGHGAAGTPYGARRQADFLVRKLHGVAPRW